MDKKLVRSKSVHRTKRQKEIFNRRLSQKKLKAQLKSWVQNLGLETIFLGAVLIVCDQTWSLTILFANSLDQLLTWEMLRRNCMFQWKWRIAIKFHSNITNIIINIISSIWLGYSRSRRWNKQVVCTIRFTRKTTSATLSSPCHRQKKKKITESFAWIHVLVEEQRSYTTKSHETLFTFGEKRLVAPCKVI